MIVMADYAQGSCALKRHPVDFGKIVPEQCVGDAFDDHRGVHVGWPAIRALVLEPAIRGRIASLW